MRTGPGLQTFQTYVFYVWFSRMRWACGDVPCLIARVNLILKHKAHVDEQLLRRVPKRRQRREPRRVELPAMGAPVQPRQRDGVDRAAWLKALACCINAWLLGMAPWLEGRLRRCAPSPVRRAVARHRANRLGSGAAQRRHAAGRSEVPRATALKAAAAADGPRLSDAIRCDMMPSAI